MTEETKTEVVVPQTEESSDAQEPQFTEVEQRAMEMGWRPKTEFQGDEIDFIDAKEFVNRKPLFDKIESQSKEIKNVRKAIEALKTHYTQRESAAVQSALTKLRESRQEAISNADGAQFEVIDTEIKRVEKEASRLEVLNETQNVSSELPAQFIEWTNKNKWYKDNKYMRTWADDYGIELSKTVRNPDEVLKMVEVGVRKEFPDKFNNPNKITAPNVENSSRGQTGSKSKDSVVLTDAENKVMKMLVSTKTMTKDEYIAGIKAMRDSSK